MHESSVGSVEHRIGTTGLVALEVVRGSVRVRGSDGEDARVTVRSGGGHDPRAFLKVNRLADSLLVDVRGAPWSGAGAGLRGDIRSVDLDVAMPRGGRLDVNGISADVRVSGVMGDQRHRSVSGDLEATGVFGSFTAQVVSGHVRVEGGTYRYEGVSTSGGTHIRADRLVATRVRSVSGDVALAAAFEPEGTHRVETLSGDLRIVPNGGLTVSARGMSTRILSQLEHRSESHIGRRTAIVGDGRAQLEFRSMSGDVSLVAGDIDPAAYGEGTVGPRHGDRRDPIQDAGPSDQPDRPVDELSILRALERGEIDIDEAARLLEDEDHA